MNLLYFLQTNLAILLVVMAVFGLIIGSFLNVVIYRYPIMLKAEWRRECQTFLELPIDKSTGEKFNLSHPRSHCPNCNKKLSAWHNIPLLSFLLLGGRCAYCHTSISIRYPLIELLSAILAVLVAWRFGVGWVLLAGLVFSWMLIAMSMIDFNEMLIPDPMTYSLLWLGLLINYFDTFATLKSAVLGAIVGYLSLWLIANLYQKLRHRDGLGYGDCKLFAMLGAWFGLPALLPIILIGSVLSILVSLILLAFKKIQFQQAIPFGPYLAFAGLVMLFLHADFLRWLLTITG